MSFAIATFYKFVLWSDLPQKQTIIKDFCQEQEVKGTILLAREGINGTIAGAEANVKAVLAFLRSDSCLEDLEHKTSYTQTPPFQRLKVRIKPEIVTLGKPEVNPIEGVGTYIQAKDWNELIRAPETILVDTRNDYEVRIGTFKGARNPQTRSFREFPEYVQENLSPDRHQKIAMFCTGGIRCEKATAYLLSQGFEQVYHLKGGILKYLEEVPPEASLWEGDCFVFDERVTVKHGLEVGEYQLCPRCGNPILAGEKEGDRAGEIGCCYCSLIA